MPSDRTALFYRGQLAAVLGVDLVDGEAALRAYLKGPFILAEPPVGYSWWRLGQVLEKEGKISQAREAYMKAVGIDGRDDDYRQSLRLLDETSPRVR